MLHISKAGNTYALLEASGESAAGLHIWPSSSSADERNWIIGAWINDQQTLSFRSSDAKDGNPASAGTSHMVIDGITGNVGIGTVGPAYPLDVNGHGKVSGQFALGSGADNSDPAYLLRINHTFSNTDAFGVNNFITLTGIPNTGMINYDASATFNSTGQTLPWRAGLSIRNMSIPAGTVTNQYGIRIEDISGASDNYSIYTGGAKSHFGGNVGIGTTSPQYDLDVIGDIRATGSVYYGGTAGTADGTAYTKPDFVFEDGYRAMTTDEVETYLKEEGHLPWMTSARQEREENGQAVNITRMSFETVETVENLQLPVFAARPGSPAPTPQPRPSRYCYFSSAGVICAWNKEVSQCLCPNFYSAFILLFSAHIWGLSWPGS